MNPTKEEAEEEFFIWRADPTPSHFTETGLFFCLYHRSDRENKVILRKRHEEYCKVYDAWESWKGSEEEFFAKIALTNEGIKPWTWNL